MFVKLDEYEHINLDKGGEDSHAKVQPYKSVMEDCNNNWEIKNSLQEVELKNKMKVQYFDEKFDKVLSLEMVLVDRNRLCKVQIIEI